MAKYLTLLLIHFIEDATPVEPDRKHIFAAMP